jgi:hypothetical protein
MPEVQSAAPGVSDGFYRMLAYIIGNTPNKPAIQVCRKMSRPVLSPGLYPAPLRLI